LLLVAPAFKDGPVVVEVNVGAPEGRVRLVIKRIVTAAAA
jgi:hypothetical protein